MEAIKRIWIDYRNFVVFQGQQDYYRHPIRERIIPTISWVLLNSIYFILIIPFRIYIKIVLDRKDKDG